MWLESEHASHRTASLISFDGLKRRKLWRWALAYVAGAWALLQVADLVGDRFGWPDIWLRWLIVVVGIGFCVTLVLGWYHGERAAQRVSLMELGILTSLLVIAGIALYAIDSPGGVAPPTQATAPAHGIQATPDSLVSETAPAQEPVERASIAVLPFQNMSSESEQEYFSDGLTEELLNLLAQIPELRVAARTSAFAYKGKHETIDVIGKTLRVAHIVEGSVRKSGERIRITVQLIDAASGFHKWSQTYDRALTDVFAVQDEISRAIVGELRVRVAEQADPTSVTTKPEAYAHFLKGTQALRKTGSPREYLGEAEREFVAALEIDPDYSAALSGMADTIRSQSYNSLIPREEGYKKAREYAERALKLNPQDWNAHGQLGMIADWADRDFETAERHYRRSLELNSSMSRTRSYYGWLLIRLGRVDEGLREAQHAVDIDPLSIAARTNLATLLAFAGQPDRAVAEYQAALALDPKDVVTTANLAFSYASLGRNAEAVATAERALQLDPDFAFSKVAVGYVYARVGRREDAERILEQLRKRSDVVPTFIATIHIGLGNRDAAFRYLNEAVETQDEYVIDIGMDPLFDPLRGDPRMDSLLKRLKLNEGAAR